MILGQDTRKRCLLNKDPYIINDWTDSPETIPDVHYSDMMLYVTVTPSPYTREAIKVRFTLLAD